MGTTLLHRTHMKLPFSHHLTPLWRAAPSTQANQPNGGPTTSSESSLMMRRLAGKCSRKPTNGCECLQVSECGRASDSPPSGWPLCSTDPGSCSWRKWSQPHHFLSDASRVDKPPSSCPATHKQKVHLNICIESLWFVLSLEFKQTALEKLSENLRYEVFVPLPEAQKETILTPGGGKKVVFLDVRMCNFSKFLY